MNGNIEPEPLEPSVYQADEKASNHVILIPHAGEGSAFVCFQQETADVSAHPSGFLPTVYCS
jgi:hypothetical protein